jgi:dihydrofolate reductase
MELHIVVAAAENGVIGRDGSVPWHYPEDVAHYRSTVAGHPVIVGRRTFDSMEPLPESLNVVLTSDPDRTADHPDVRYVTGVDEAVAAAAGTGADVGYVIGGQGVYEAFLPHVRRVVLSRIHETVAGDRFFPELGDEWTEVARDEREGFSIVEYVQEDPDPVPAPVSAPEPADGESAG